MEHICNETWCFLLTFTRIYINRIYNWYGDWPHWRRALLMASLICKLRAEHASHNEDRWHGNGVSKDRSYVYGTIRADSRYKQMTAILMEYAYRSETVEVEDDFPDVSNARWRQQWQNVCTVKKSYTLILTINFHHMKWYTRTCVNTVIQCISI